MKNIVATLFIPLLLSAAATAQVRIGPFLGYGEQLGLWGLGAHAEILLSDKVSASAVLTQYFPDDINQVPRRNVWELNTNLNYYFFAGEVAYFYGLTGVNFTHFKIRSPGVLMDVVEKDSNLGINVGAGTLIRINELLLPFAEVKYTAGEYSQLSVTVGVRFQLGEGTLEDDF